MMAKNEEHCIRKCLNSVKHIVDEMIVVDTGSTDKTKEIAKELGAKVFDFKWIDDFSAARNFSLSKAKCDWILVLDADEFIQKKDAQKILDLINEPEFDEFGFDRLEYLKDCKTGSIKLIDVQKRLLRLFQNIPQHYFEGAVAEYVGGNPMQTDVVIIHHQDKSKLEKSHAYYEKLCLIEVERFPSRTEPLFTLLKLRLAYDNIDGFNDVLKRLEHIELKNRERFRPLLDEIKKKSSCKKYMEGYKLLKYYIDVH